MPFAGYRDFEDCKSKNRDKNDPDAYCGSIKHQVEDKAMDHLAKAIRLSAHAGSIVQWQTRAR